MRIPRTLNAREKTAKTIRSILDFLYRDGHFAWRENVLPVPLAGGGFRSGGKPGIPDIVGIRKGGQFLGIEIKTGKDRLRDVQIGFHTQARKLGALILVVKDFEDFLEQWKQLN